MSNRTIRERFPRYSIKAWFGSLPKGVRKLYRRAIRAKQRQAFRHDPESSDVREDHKHKPIANVF